MALEKKERTREANRKWDEANREKRREHNRKWKKANPENHSLATANRRMRKAGKPELKITVAELKELRANHDGCCNICADQIKLCVDHNHETGEVRGLLCKNCNTSLGNFKDDPDRLINAALYLGASRG